jgi:hypothetical protein
MPKKVGFGFHCTHDAAQYAGSQLRGQEPPPLLANGALGKECLQTSEFCHCLPTAPKTGRCAGAAALVGRLPTIVAVAPLRAEWDVYFSAFAFMASRSFFSASALQ